MTFYTIVQYIIIGMIAICLLLAAYIIYVIVKPNNK